MPAYWKLVKKTFCLDDPRKRKNSQTDLIGTRIPGGGNKTCIGLQVLVYPEIVMGSSPPSPSPFGAGVGGGRNKKSEKREGGSSTDG